MCALVEVPKPPHPPLWHPRWLLPSGYRGGQFIVFVVAVAVTVAVTVAATTAAVTVAATTAAVTAAN